ncbi:MAG: hypothetical protein O3B01_24725 [Planctomycetota bacterium]|nr:hypothetical protein [Planctomycetota bacterium]MDA1141781.1 hypothetical protein [Planctomycetota bacterium]
MKKVLTIILLIAVATAVGYLFLSGKVPGLQSDRQIIIQQTRRFFECVKFKEYAEAGNFHNATDRKDANIPKMIESLFKVPPEQLDIQEYNVVFGEVDTSGLLGRVKTRCVVRTLNVNDVRKPEIILYWKKEGENWYLKLRSSLERFPGGGPTGR